MKTKQEIEILKEIEKLGGKVKHIYDREYSGAILKIDGKYYVGQAKLSKYDQYQKKIARIITLSRAMKNYRNNISINPIELMDYAKFREDVIIKKE